MGLKITYTDTATGSVLRETTLDDDEVKAFEYVAYDPIDWIDNCFQNRARQAVDEVVEEALGRDEKITIKDADMNSALKGIGIVAKVKDIPVKAKKDIVKKSTFETAKERTDKPQPV
jgi:hypothetical protein|tara:strand:- start:372 stop:722 length:351 start_codon:yes stop_codon:yes gene_type:complete